MKNIENNNQNEAIQSDFDVSDIEGKLQMFSEIAQSVFNRHQGYAADLHIFRKDKTVCVVDCEPFLESKESKLAMSFMIQYTCILLEDVDFLIFASEGYCLESKVNGPEDNPEYRQKIIEQYGSIAECPFSKEILNVIYDDGKMRGTQVWFINKNDQGKRVLDQPQEPVICPDDDPITINGNILVSLIRKSEEIKSLMNFIKSKIRSEVTPEIFQELDFYKISADVLSNNIGDDAPRIGYELASEMVQAINSRELDKENEHVDDKKLEGAFEAPKFLM